MLTLPRHEIRPGNSIACQINGQPAQVHLKNVNTLVIEPDDERTILTADVGDAFVTLICGDSHRSADDHQVTHYPKGGFIVEDRSE
jgi:hypothetical protein